MGILNSTGEIYGPSRQSFVDKIRNGRSIDRPFAPLRKYDGVTTDFKYIVAGAKNGGNVKRSLGHFL